MDDQELGDLSLMRDYGEGEVPEDILMAKVTKFAKVVTTVVLWCHREDGAAVQEDI